MGVFGYSDDEQNASYALGNKVPAGVIYRRKRRLMAMQRKISRRRNRALVGQRFRILVKGPSVETDLLWEGRLETQAEEIDGTTYITDVDGAMPQPGDFGEIRITRAGDYDLFGKLESVEVRRAPLPVQTVGPLKTAEPVLLPVLQ